MSTSQPLKLRVSALFLPLSLYYFFASWSFSFSTFMRPRASVHLKLHRTSRLKRPLCPCCCRPRSALSEGMVLPRSSKGTTGRMDKFTRGVVWGMSLAGLKPKDIVGKVHKKDGVRPKVRAVQKFIAKKKRFPEWQGDDSRAGGRPQELSAGEQKSLVDLVFEERLYVQVLSAFMSNTADELWI